MLTGSHRNGYVPHSDTASHLGLPEWELDSPSAVCVEGEAGDAIFFHQHLVSSLSPGVGACSCCLHAVLAGALLTTAAAAARFTAPPPTIRLLLVPPSSTATPAPRMLSSCRWRLPSNRGKRHSRRPRRRPRQGHGDRCCGGIGFWTAPYGTWGRRTTASSTEHKYFLYKGVRRVCYYY